MWAEGLRKSLIQGKRGLTWRSDTSHNAYYVKLRMDPREIPRQSASNRSWSFTGSGTCPLRFRIHRFTSSTNTENAIAV